jgi:hypothetical protein
MRNELPMETFKIIALIIAALCFAGAAFGYRARFDLIAIGLLAWVLVALVPLLD